MVDTAQKGCLTATGWNQASRFPRHLFAALNYAHDPWGAVHARRRCSGISFALGESHPASASLRFAHSTNRDQASKLPNGFLP